MTSGQHGDLDHTVEDFVRKVPGVTHTVVVSPDGLPAAASAGLSRDAADRLAAVTSGLASVTSAAARALDGDLVKQTVVEMGRGYLLVMTVRGGSVVATLASDEADLGTVGYEMVHLVDQVGDALAPALA